LGETCRKDFAILHNHNQNQDEIVFTSGATEAINLVVQSYGRNNLQAGDEIILTVAEHHSNLVPWQLLAHEKNLTLRFIPLDPNTQLLDLKVFQTLLSNEKTKVVAFQHVSNVLSTVNPVQEMVQMVKQHAHPNAVILLDACQSLPNRPVNVQDLQVDFLVASGHKLCGPTGIGFLWGKEQLLNEKMPPWKGGGEMIDTVTLETSKVARRSRPIRSRDPGHCASDWIGRRVGLPRFDWGYASRARLRTRTGRVLVSTIANRSGIATAGTLVGGTPGGGTVCLCASVGPSQ
jgi:selenocysteine lyase/cysteine desulfurase